MRLDSKQLAPWVLLVASVVTFWETLGSLVHLGLENNRYTHVILIPLASAFFLWLRREADRPGSRAAVAGCLLGGVLATAAGLMTADAELRLAASTLAMFLVWSGIAMLRVSSLFPLLLLLAAVPLPSVAMDQVVAFLQNVSVAVATWLFQATGTPAVRNGLVFVFADFDVEVAKECSGLRGAISTVLAATLAGQLFLRRGWTRTAFVLTTIPVVILKNAVRIAGITWFGLYVDRGFFGGTLHRYSGIPFTLLSVGLMLPLLWSLQRADAEHSKA